MARLGWTVAAGSGWMIGSALQTLQAKTIEPPWSWVALVAAGAAIGGLFRWARGGSGAVKHAAWIAAGLLLASGLAGWAVTDWRAQVRLAQRLDPGLEGVDLQVVGIVTGMPTRRPEGLRFAFEVESAVHQGRPVPLGSGCPESVSVGWYRQPDAQQEGAGDGWAFAQALRAGERWRFTLRLKRPHGTLNPHGFDYELWMFEQGLRAVGYVRDGAGLRDSERPARLGPAGAALIERWRQGWRDALLAQVGERPAAGVLAALAVGDQAAIERSDWDVFRATGVAHLVAISGLHVTMFAWLCGRLVAGLWRRSSRAMHVLPAPEAARWGGLCAALLYALLAGWGVPAQRTVVMLAAATLVRASGLRWPGPLVLWWSALAVVLFDPWAWLQAGFWLSFVAVALLMTSDRVGLSAAPGGAGQRAAWAGMPREQGHLSAMNEPRDAPAPEASGRVEVTRLQRLAARVGRPLDLLRAGWRSQWVASVGLAPWTLLFFQQLSLVGLLANAWAIPLVTLLITPLALAGLLWAPLWSLGAWLIEVMMQGLGVMAAWPWASWSIPVAPLWCRVAALIGVVSMVWPLPWRVRGLGVVCCLPMLWPPLDRPREGHFELVAADVGQGSAVLVRTRSHVLMYDAGPQYSLQADAGARVLAPLLRALEPDRLDLLVLSHRDSDHTGGADTVLRQVGAHAVMSSLQLGHELRGAAVHQPCMAGQTWIWDGVRFEILHPAERQYRRAEQRLLSANGLSCVLRIQGTAAAALLTGDLEREQELAMVAAQQSGSLQLAADVLLVPHHGSRTSSSAEFVQAVRPRVAVAQLGWRNRYGHPSAQVVARYGELGVPLVRTDLCGAWRWRSDTMNAQCERGERARYWHAPFWEPGTQGDGPELAKSNTSNSPSP